MRSRLISEKMTLELMEKAAESEWYKTKDKWWLDLHLRIGRKLRNNGKGRFLRINLEEENDT